MKKKTHPEVRIPPHPMITSYTTTTAPQLKVYRNPYDKIGPREIKDAVRTQDGDSLVSRNYVQLSKTCQWFSFCILVVINQPIMTKYYRLYALDKQYSCSAMQHILHEPQLEKH